MDTEAFLPAIFSTFRDLNLITLIQNLRQGRVSRGDWSDGSRLCPLAHGFPSGAAVQQACDSCATLPPPGVAVAAVQRFLSHWDGEELSDAALAAELRALWLERQADADAVQGVLTRPREAVLA